MKKRLSEVRWEGSIQDSDVAIAELTDQAAGRAVEGQAGHRLISGVIVGKLVGFRQAFDPLVDFPGNTCARALLARSAVSLHQSHVGREILLSFEGGEPEKPVVVGIMNDLGSQKQKAIDITMDDETVVFTAQKEITLKCGKASITLTRAGKILIRGAYLLSRSSGVNRIKGGSVQIN